jgi:rSAM/selenodomain-associated transferase 2
MKFSVIIPVFNEAENLVRTLDALRNCSEAPEIIVVDGGSTDGSVEAARRYASDVVISPKGRGIQQDTGARHAKGDVFIFLHADTLLPDGYDRMIFRALADPAVVFGAFSLAIYPPSPALNLIASVANLRSRILKLPYGDQALFIRQSAYVRSGGFPPWPIMEDVDLVRRLNALGTFRLIRTPVKTSARRWGKENPLFTTLRNWSLMIRYALGASPQDLICHYSDTR